MRAEYAAFGRAQVKVAKTRQAHEAALAELESATEAVAGDVQRAWEANEAAVRDASTAIEAAVQNLARVQVESATAARARARGQAPVLTDDEMALLTAAEGLVTEATVAHAEAKDRFKAGVTAEQLDAMGT